MKRRELLTTGTLGSLLGAFALPPAAAAAQAQSAGDERALERIVQALGDLRTELHDQRQFTEIAAIRAAQKQHLRANGKLPDFIEVGSDIWFQVYDWHVRWQQPIAESRDGQGRPTLAMNQTLVVLRPDLQATYIGLPFDAR